MSAIEQRARALLATELEARGLVEPARELRSGDSLASMEPGFAASVAAVIAALTPPEGYVLVPVETLFDLVDDAETHVRATEFRPARLVHKLRSVAEAKILLAARPEVP